MKKLIFLFSLLACVSVSAFAQESCPSGQSWLSGWETSGCSFESGCYTSEKAKEISAFMGKCMCGETGLGLFTVDKEGKLTGYSRSGKWENDKCNWTYSKAVHGVWTEISLEEYNCIHDANWSTLVKTRKGKMVWVKIKPNPSCAQYK